MDSPDQVNTTDDLREFISDFLGDPVEQIAVTEGANENNITIKSNKKIPKGAINALEDFLEKNLPAMSPLAIEYEPTIKKQVEDSMAEKAQEIFIESKQRGPNLEGAGSMSESKQFKIGEQVQVKNIDGAKVEAEIVALPTKKAGEYDADWSGRHDTLSDVWGSVVSDYEKVIEVKLDHVENSNTYAYPISKVFPLKGDLTRISGIGSNKAETLREAGYQTIDDLVKAHQNELSEVTGIGNALAARIKADIAQKEFDEVDEDDVVHVGFECPQCGDAFSKNENGIIEGDEGEMYCGIECLNESYT